MTYSRRAEIFSKECLTIKDIQDLFEVGYDDAAKIIRDIKRSLKFAGKKLRLDINGRLHVQDYLDYNEIDNQARYVPTSFIEGGAGV